MSEDNDNQVKSPAVLPLIIALSFVVFAWLTNFWLLSVRPEFTKAWDFLGARGDFGDQFGAVNAAFSGFAFAGVVYAVFLQRHEIKIARREIKYTKKILDKQQEQLELQNKETQKQAFESTFFQLLRLFTELTNQMDLRFGERITKGKDVFPVFLSRVKRRYETSKNANASMAGADGLKQAYEIFYDENNAELGHYFRTLYNILKFIEASDISNKKFYSNILRAQLSNAEVGLIYYNGLSTYGVEKLKPLIERYCLLKNLSGDVIIFDEMINEYSDTAFG